MKIIRNTVERLALDAVATMLPGQQSWAPLAMDAEVPAWSLVFATEFREAWGPMKELLGTKSTRLWWDRLLSALNRYVRWHLDHDLVPEALNGIRALAACAYFQPIVDALPGEAREASWRQGTEAMLQTVSDTLDLWNALRWSH